MDSETRGSKRKDGPLEMNPLRPEDKAILCFGMLGVKTLWNLCGVKLRIRKGPLWGLPWKSLGGKKDRVTRTLMMGCFGFVSLGVSWAIWDV